ncbi:MAG: putative cytokinetic ring protein SteA [Chthonomonadales bacterium]
MATATTELIQGPIRANRRTKDLVKDLRPGDVAFIRHADLDATAARALIDCQPAAVLNASTAITGRYPNRGPGLLLEAGIPFVDSLEESLFLSALNSQHPMCYVRGGDIQFGACSGSGIRYSTSELEKRLESAKANLQNELQSFARNTLEYIEEEKSILLDPIDLPDLKTKLSDRHVLIVVRGEGYKEDLKAIADYVAEVRPALIGVDGGADALLQEGWKPDIIIGDMDSVSDQALRCGAELIVHGYVNRDREVPGLERLKALGLTSSVFHAPGTSEDVAILLADEKGATLIVAVGTHFSMVEFLDKGRGGMASTFLVRLRTGAKLLDAKGIGRLWATRSKPATREIAMLVIAAMFPVGVIAIYSPWFRTVLTTLRLTFQGK